MINECLIYIHKAHIQFIFSYLLYTYEISFHLVRFLLMLRVSFLASWGSVKQYIPCASCTLDKKDPCSLIYDLLYSSFTTATVELQYFAGQTMPLYKGQLQFLIIFNRV